MTNLKEKVGVDFKEAFKAKDEIRLSVLKMLKSEISNAEIAKKGKLAKAGEADTDAKSVLNDDEVTQLISREIKKRKDSIEMFEKGGRTDLADKEKSEMAVLSAYLPEQMREKEIRGLVKKAIEQTGAKDIKDLGKVMGVLTPQTRGRADGALVNKIVREVLG